MEKEDYSLCYFYIPFFSTQTMMNVVRICNVERGIICFLPQHFHKDSLHPLPVFFMKGT